MKEPTQHDVFVAIIRQFESMGWNPDAVILQRKHPILKYFQGLSLVRRLYGFKK